MAWGSSEKTESPFNKMMDQLNDAIEKHQFRYKAYNASNQAGEAGDILYKSLTKILKITLQMEGYTEEEINAGIAISVIATIGVFHTRAMEGFVQNAMPDLKLF